MNRNSDYNGRAPDRKVWGASSILSGVAITVGANYSVRLVNLLITVMLARAVSVEGMGVVAAALLAVEVIDALRDFGLRDAIISRQTVDRRFLDTAFFVIIVVALLQAGAILAVAPLSPRFIEDPQIEPLLQWLSLLFVLNALGSVQEAMMQREGMFTERATAEFAGVAVKLAVAYALIRADYGVASIVAAILASAATRTLVLTVYSTWRGPMHLPSRENLRWLVKYGRHIILVNVTFLMRTKADQMAIVTLLGDFALGLYFVAARLPEIVISGVNMAITTVVFPGFSIASHDTTALRKSYLATLKACMMLMAPVSVGLAVVATPLIEVLFGAEWGAAAPVLGLLALTGILITLGWSVGDVLKAIRRPDLLGLISLSELVVVVPLVWLTAGLSGDIVAVAAAMGLGSAAGSLLRLVVVRSHLGVGLRESVRSVLPSIVAALMMGGGVVLFRQEIESASPLVELSLSVAVGAVLYAVFLPMLALRDLRDMRASLRASRRSLPEDPV